MKKTFLLTCIVTVLFSIVNLSAQGQQQGNRQIMSNDFWERRNTFIKSAVGLTANEASIFIPLENEFKQKQLEIGRECRNLERESLNKQKMTDDEYLKLIDCYLDNRIKEAQIEKEYFEKFKNVVKPDKLQKYREADARFSRELVNMRRTIPVERNNTNSPGNRNNTNQSGNRR